MRVPVTVDPDLLLLPFRGVDLELGAVRTARCPTGRLVPAALRRAALAPTAWTKATRRLVPAAIGHAQAPVPIAVRPGCPWRGLGVPALPSSPVISVISVISAIAVAVARIVAVVSVTVVSPIPVVPSPVVVVRSLIQSALVALVVAQSALLPVVPPLVRRRDLRARLVPVPPILLKPRLGRVGDASAVRRRFFRLDTPSFALNRQGRDFEHAAVLLLFHAWLDFDPLAWRLAGLGALLRRKLVQAENRSSRSRRLEAWSGTLPESAFARGIGLEDVRRVVVHPVDFGFAARREVCSARDQGLVR